MSSPDQGRDILRDRGELFGRVHEGQDAELVEDFLVEINIEVRNVDMNR